MLIDGIHVPLAAPFYRDGLSYFRKLEHNVARYSLTPPAGLLALPPGGEAAALSDADTAETLKIVGEVAAPGKVLVAGIAKSSVIEALRLAELAATARFDAVLLSYTPSGPSAANWREARLFLQAVADASPLPVLLWSEAQASGAGLPLEVCSRLAAHSNVIGQYEANLDVDRLTALQTATAAVAREVVVTTTFTPVTRRMLTVPEPEAGVGGTFISAALLGGGGTSLAVAPPVPALKTRTKKVGFQIMAAGRTENLVDLLQAGAAGAMPMLAACAPQACFEAFAALKDGDPALAAEKAARLTAADRWVEEHGIAATKYGCDLNGYFGGRPRLPVLPLNGDEQAEFGALMRELRN